MPDYADAIGVLDPNKPGFHLGVQPMIDKGLELCGTSTATASPTRKPNQPAGLVERESWTDGIWPLTVDYATLNCTKGVDGERVTITANREMYALNGTAKAANLWPDFDAIWRDDPKTPGMKVNIGPMVDRGLTLCST